MRLAREKKQDHMLSLATNIETAHGIVYAAWKVLEQSGDKDAQTIGYALQGAITALDGAWLDFETISDKQTT